MLVSSDSTVSHLQIHLWCFIFQLYKKQNKLLWSLETRRTEPRKSEIFDPVILLRCCNNGSVQRGKIMLVPCAHVRKQNQFRERGGSYVKCWSEVLFFFYLTPHAAVVSAKRHVRFTFGLVYFWDRLVHFAVCVLPMRRPYSENNPVCAPTNRKIRSGAIRQISGRLCYVKNVILFIVIMCIRRILLLPYRPRWCRKILQPCSCWFTAPTVKALLNRDDCDRYLYTGQRKDRGNLQK